MTLRLVHSRPDADPATLELSVLAASIGDAALREDMVQMLISAADLDRMVRSLGPHQRAAADHARDLIAQTIDMLESLLERSHATARRDPRQTAYAQVSGAR